MTGGMLRLMHLILTCILACHLAPDAEAVPQPARPGRPSPAPRDPPSREAAASRATPADHVTNPSGGASIAVYLDAPTTPGPHPAVVLVPGGLGAAGGVAGPGGILAFTDAGIVVVRFDPDGRGQSSGAEDYQGPNQQEGLRQVIRWAIARPEVQDDAVGVVSYSLGVSIAAGALDGGTTAARFLIDVEGPPSRSWMQGCQAGDAGSAFGGRACTDNAYFAPREAVTHVAGMKVPYMRVQAARDHFQGDRHDHAYEILEAAAGHLPWVRLNDLAPSASGYDRATVDASLPAQLDRHTLESWLPPRVLEMFRLAGLG